MTGALRKNQKVLWMLISAAVIISFVIYFSPNQPSLNGDDGADFGLMDGRPLKRDAVRAANRLAALGGRLRFGENYDSPQAKQMGFDLEQETFRTILLQARVREYGIHVSDEAVATWIRQNLRDERGVVNYDAFIESRVKGSREGFTEADFQQWVRLQVATEHLYDVIGVTGELVTPRAAEAEFRQENQTYLASLALFSTSNYLASVNLDPAALTQFYSNRIAVYRIPERMVLSYVRFDLTNYTAQAELDLAGNAQVTNELEQIYLQQGADAFRDELGQPLAREAALRQLREMQLAMKESTAFANELYGMTPPAAENLATLAGRKGLAVQTTEPFTEFGRPLGLADMQNLPQALAAVNAEQPFTTPMNSARGFAIAALIRRVPSEIPPYEAVASRVAEDYKRTRAQEAARAAGEAFAAGVTNALAAGKSFAAFAAEQNVAVTELPAFSLASPAITGLDPRLNPNTIKSSAFSLQPGKTSGFVLAGDSGYVMFLKEKQPVGDDIVKSGLNAFLEERRQQGRSAAFNEWLNAEFQQSGLAALMTRAEPAQ